MKEEANCDAETTLVSASLASVRSCMLPTIRWAAKLFVLGEIAMKKRSAVMLVLALLSIYGQTANSTLASTIVWDAPKTIAGDSDVSLTGTLDRAYNFTGDTSDPTVNGVTFNAFKGITSTLGDTTNAPNFNDSAFGSVNSPFASLSSGYQALLKSAAYYDSLTVTLNGLTQGNTYQVQLWLNDARVYGVGRTQTVNGSLPYSQNIGTVDGGVGQYVTGAFMADSTSEVFAFWPGSAGYGGQVNALQLRSIPEPSSVVLLVAGLLGLLAYARRKQK